MSIRTKNLEDVVFLFFTAELSDQVLLDRKINNVKMAKLYSLSVHLVSSVGIHVGPTPGVDVHLSSAALHLKPPDVEILAGEET